MKNVLLRRLVSGLVAVWIVCSGAAVYGGEEAGTGHGGMLSPMKKAPTLDGTLEPGESDLSIRTVNFTSIGNQMMDPREGATMLGYFGDRLYVSVVSELPPRPAKGPYSKATTRDAEVIWDANAIEIWFDPNRDHRDSGNGDQAFYQMFINTLGTTEDARLVPGNAPDKGWNPDVQSAHGLDSEKKLWTAEVSIAMKDLGMDPAKLTGSSMGLLISRNYKMPWCQVTAVPLFHGGIIRGSILLTMRRWWRSSRWAKSSFRQSRISSLRCATRAPRARRR